VNQFAWTYKNLQLPTYQLPASIKVTFSGAPTPVSAESIKELTDGVWTAVRTQAEQQARANAEKAQQAKTKKPTSKRSKSVKAPYAPPPPPLPKPKHPKQISPTPTQQQQQTSGGVKQKQVGTANPHTKNDIPTQATSGGDKHTQANLTNPHLPNALPTQQMGGGMPQQQHNVANPTQLQQPPHKPLTQQQMRLQRRNSTLLRRNTSV
jgi:hypothetical protein